jgi:hypothetical protein
MLHVSLTYSYSPRRDPQIISDPSDLGPSDCWRPAAEERERVGVLNRSSPLSHRKETLALGATHGIPWRTTLFNGNSWWMVRISRHKGRNLDFHLLCPTLAARRCWTTRAPKAPQGVPQRCVSTCARSDPSTKGEERQRSLCDRSLQRGEPLPMAGARKFLDARMVRTHPGTLENKSRKC